MMWKSFQVFLFVFVVMVALDFIAATVNHKQQLMLAQNDVKSLR